MSHLYTSVIMGTKAKLTESQIREIFAESGKMTVREMISYLEARHSGNYDKKVARDNATELVADMKNY